MSDSIAKLALVSNARVPSQRAQSLQVLQVAAAFCAEGVPTVLLHARRRSTPVLAPEELFAHYGLATGPRPVVQAISCMDFIDVLPRALQYLPARLQELTFARSAARRLRRDYPAHWILTRELETAFSLRGRARLFLELHRVPGGRTRRRWLLAAARDAAGVVAISGGVRQDLLALGVEAEKVSVQHDGYDPGRFERLPGQVDAREQLGLEAERPLVVYTGGLMRWKGVDLLVEAARQLPRVSFVIAGGMDADVRELRRQAAGLKHVRIDGFQPPARVPLYLAAADLGVVPNRSTPAISARYTSPLKVFEAMAAGLPLVCSDLPSLREILDEEGDLFVSPDEPAALAQGIERALADPDALRSLGERMRARACQHTWGARARRMLEWMRARAGE